MDAVKKSEAFHQFLDSLLTLHEDGVFLDDYKASLLGAGTSTPFSAFVGEHDRPTIVISKHVPESSEVSVSVKGSTNLDNEGLELLADLSTSKRGGDDPLPVITEQFVPVGQPLDSSRAYLTHSSPFYRGWSGTLIQTTTFAQDNGLVPLPLGLARFIASLYSLGFRRAKGTLPDVWVLCERNPQNINALGCRCDGPKCPLHIITVEGGATLDTNPRVDTHSDTLSAGAVFSEYDIINASFKETGQSGEFKIQFSWNDPDGILSSPPESSDAILKLSSMPGDQFSPVLSMYEELQSLYRLCKILNSGMDWPVPEEEEEILVSGNRTAKEVDIFIQDMAHPLTTPADITVMSPTTDHMIYEPRTDLDFTERLWLFCHDVRSFNELQLVFAEVFKALLLGKIQPFIHRKSASKLATLLRQVLLSPDRVQDTTLQFQLLLTEAHLLPCLVQIGIEKIRRDYQSFFVGTDICSAEQFDRFFNPSSSLLAQCLELCRTHSVLELNTSIMKLLRLPTTTILSTFTKAAMEVFKADSHYQPFERTPVFSLPLPAYSPALKSVVALCSKLSPVTWCITREQSKKKERGGVYLLRNRPLFGYLSDPEETVTNTSPTNKDGYYLHKCYCKVIP